MINEIFCASNWSIRPRSFAEYLDARYKLIGGADALRNSSSCNQSRSAAVPNLASEWSDRGYGRTDRLAAMVFDIRNAGIKRTALY